MLLIEQISADHHYERYEAHYEQDPVALTAADRSYDTVDLSELLSLGDRSHVGRLLERADLVGVLCDSEDQIRYGREEHAQGASELCEERPDGGDDGLVPGAVLILVVFDRVEYGEHHDHIVAVHSQLSQHVADGRDPE